MFANMYQALETLSPGLRRTLGGLEAVYDVMAGVRTKDGRGAAALRKQWQVQPLHRAPGAADYDRSQIRYVRRTAVSVNRPAASCKSETTSEPHRRIAMLRVGTIEDALAGNRRRHFDVEGGKFRGYTDFMFESEPGQPLGPQAFLVHQAPDWELPVHFHMQYQMQVIVGGSGKLGRHAVGPGSVHYATPQSAYGPLKAGPEGVEYFTLRVLTDKGAWYMPESRPMMEMGKPKSQATGDLSFGATPVSAATLIALRPDGAGAWAYRAGAGETVRCSEPASPAGRFHVVLRGSFRLGADTVPRHGCVYWSPPDEPPEFEAVEVGSELVVVQFPEVALHNVVDPEVLAKAPQQVSATASAACR